LPRWPKRSGAFGNSSPRYRRLSIRIEKANLHRMSLAEIEQAVDKLSRDELAKLAAYIARQDKLGWDEQIEEDFAPGGKHGGALERIDAEIDAGNFRPMP
jgi:hypothetical protein